MERLRKTFTSFVLFSVLAGITLILFSCNQQTAKQQTAANGTTQAGKTDSNAVVPAA